MEEQKDGMNQNNIDNSLPQEIPIPGVEQQTNDSDAGQQMNNHYTGQQMSNPYQHNPYGQQTNDPYAGQQTNNPYAGQQVNDPYALQQMNNPYQHNPYGQQSEDPYGGQFNSYNQPIDPYGQRVRPYIPQEQKRGNAVKIVIGAACVLVLIVALLIGGIVYLRSTPAYKISRGFRNLGKEMSQTQNRLVEKIGINELLLMMQEEGSHVDSSLNFATDLPLLGNTTIGIDTDFYKDMQDKELNADTTLSLMNMDFAHLNIYADEENFCFSLPELFLENMYIENEHVVSQYNNSILAQLGSQSSMEDFSIELFEDADNKVRPQEWRNLDKIWENFEGDLEACKEGMTIGKVEKGLYRVTLPQKETDKLLKDLLDSYAEMGGVEEMQDLWKDYKKLLCSDISLLFEINGSRIDSIMLEEPVSLWDNNASIEGELFFLGEVRSIDKVQGKVTIGGVDGKKREMLGQIEQISDSDTYQMNMDIKYSEEEESGKIKFIMNCDAARDEFDMTFTVKDDTDDIEVALEGSLDDIVAGESLEISLDKVTFSTDDEEVYRISGDIAIEPLRDKIKPTVKPDTAFFEMSLSDWQKIIDKLDDAYGSILNSLW
ncbi:MAG: hypothetical protein HDR09_03380 [Lachnospiraceae bacterium]|nr:hypothetical protein [Lachnospiraceae bacterium]